MPDLQTVVTKFIVDASAAISGANQVVAAHQRIAQGAQQAASQHNGFISSLTRAGASVIGFGAKLGQGIFWYKQLGSTIVGTMNALFAGNAAMEQTTIAFKGILGSGEKANAMLQDLQKFAATTPFEFPELAQAGRLLLAMGFNAQQVIPVMRNIGDTVAGLGGGSEMIQRIIYSMGQMKSMGRVTGEEMRELAIAGIPAWQWLAKAIGKDIPTAMKMAQSGAINADVAIEALQKGMAERFGGQMANQAKTFLGIMSNIKDSAGMMWRQFAGPAFEAAKGGLQSIMNLLANPAFMNFAKVAGEIVGGALSKLVGFITRAIDAISSLFGGTQQAGQAISTIGSTISNVSSIFSPFGLVIRAVMEAFRQLGGIGPTVNSLFSALAPLVQTAMQIFGALNQVIAMVVGALGTALAGALRGILPAIGPMVAALSQAAQIAGGILAQAFQMLARVLSMINWKMIGEAIGALAGGAMKILAGALQVVMAAFQALWPAIQQVVGIITSALVPVINTIVPMLMPVIQSIVQFAQQIGALLIPIIQTLAPIITGALKQIKAIWDAVFPALWPVVKAIFDLVSNGIKTALGIVSGIIKAVLAIIRGDWSGAWNAIKSVGETIWNGITGALRGVANLIGSIISGLVNIVKNLFSGLWSAVTGIWNNITSAISGAVTNAWNIVTGIVRNIVSSVTGFFTGLWQNIVSIGGNILNALTWPFRAAYDAIAGIVNGIIGWVRDALSWVGQLLGIGKAQSGVANWMGGPLWVGEAGKELVWLPKGSRVMSHAESLRYTSPYQTMAAPMAMATQRGGYGGVSTAPNVIILQIDRRDLVEALGPSMVDEIRLQLGVLR